MFSEFGLSFTAMNVGSLQASPSPERRKRPVVGPYPLKSPLKFSLSLDHITIPAPLSFGDVPSAAAESKEDEPSRSPQDSSRVSAVLPAARSFRSKVCVNSDFYRFFSHQQEL
jgi:hypothetical protein